MSDKSEREFVDTNILVYAYDVTAGYKHERARELVTELWDSRNGWISIQGLQQFYVAVTRKVPRPLDSETAAGIVDTLTRWTTYVPNSADVMAAIDLHRRNNISFWDAMILHSASQLGCATLWSEDLNPGQLYGSVRVLNPFVKPS